MPILRLSKNGIPYETDSRFDGELGFGRAADRVFDDSLELMVDEDKKKLKDRAALKNLNAKANLNQIRKYAIDLAKVKAKEQAELIAQEKLYHAKQRQATLENNRKSIEVMKALQQSGVQKEVNSGVDGYGLTADGRKPYPDRPSLDYTPEIPVDVAFGELPEGYDLSGFGADNLQVGISSMPLPSQNKQMPSESDGSEITIDGNYTTKHQYIIEMFESGLYALPYTLEYSPGNVQVFSQVLDDEFKSKISRWNSDFNSAKEVAAAATRGWMFSGWYDDEGNWVTVKVPYIFGLPMDFPNNKETYSRDSYRNYQYYSYQQDKLFNWMKPVIEAYALYYKYFITDKNVEIKTLTYEAAQAAAQEVKAAAFIESQKKASEEHKPVVKNFVHPMLKHNLLKIKAK